jgi:hypothetical protein
MTKMRHKMREKWEGLNEGQKLKDVGKVKIFEAAKDLKDGGEGKF